MKASPKTPFERFNHMLNRYGLIHATAAAIGRRSQCFWSLVGTFVSRGFIQHYLGRARPRYLNLGSGSYIIDEMLNADISPRADAYVDLNQKTPFDDDTFDFVYCEEVIEHLNREIAHRMLHEVYRILTPGGLARFTTPRLEYFIELFRNEDPMGHQINGIFYGHDHKHIYSADSLVAAMSSAGFVDIRFSSYRDETSPLGQFDSHANRYGHPAEMCLYVDVRKPGADLASPITIQPSEVSHPAN